MELSSEQKSSLERLYENESLTDNLTDADAKAVLQWAQQQIIADTDGDLVRAAVNAANESGQAGAQLVVMQAANFLTQELQARAMPTTRLLDAAAPTATENMNVSSAASFGAAGDASEQRLPTARADATIGSDTAIAPTPTPTRKKSRAKFKRKKKASR